MHNVYVRFLEQSEVGGVVEGMVDGEETRAQGAGGWIVSECEERVAEG